MQTGTIIILTIKHLVFALSMCMCVYFRKKKCAFGFLCFSLMVFLVQFDLRHSRRTYAIFHFVEFGAVERFSFFGYFNAWTQFSQRCLWLLVQNIFKQKLVWKNKYKSKFNLFFISKEYSLSIDIDWFWSMQKVTKTQSLPMKKKIPERLILQNMKCVAHSYHSCPIEFCVMWEHWNRNAKCLRI